MRFLKIWRILYFSIFITMLAGCNKEYEEIVPFRTYTALINQEATYNPVITVLENTLGVTISWTRIAQGKYIGTLDREINIEKTTVLFSTPTTHTSLRGEIRNSTEIYLEAQNGINAFTDYLSNISFELKEYK